MPEGILDRPAPVAEEYVPQWAALLGPRRHRPREKRVHVGHVDLQTDRGSPRADGLAINAPGISGNSSESSTRESPISISACRILPSGAWNRAFSLAPNAFS